MPTTALWPYSDTTMGCVLAFRESYEQENTVYCTYCEGLFRTKYVD
uniref:Uncharacterized protein n=1 Tax=Octopus bimaculoides TaxID=37653 RepID=A0A0L8HDW1_OCTBM